MLKSLSCLLFLFLISTTIFARCNYFPMDYQISEFIQAQNARDFMVNDLSIEVTTRECGIVSLNGATYTEENAMELIQIAMSTRGVRDVDTSHLYLEYGKEISCDAVMSGKIRGLLMKCNINCRDYSGLKVETTNGIVCLSGIVRCPEDKFKAIDMARHMDGVRGVVSKIKTINCACPPRVCCQV